MTGNRESIFPSISIMGVAYRGLVTPPTPTSNSTRERRRSGAGAPVLPLWSVLS